MKRYILISNGINLIAEGDTMGELEQGFAQHTATLARSKDKPILFSQIHTCAGEITMAKLCILDTVQSPRAARSYYNAGFASDIKPLK
jgi:hypothetical protein